MPQKSNNYGMFTLTIRTIILYILLLFLIRLMGKRQIGEMQPFELVLTLIIADLACVPMGENTIPILHGVIPLLSLVVLHYIMTLLSRKSMKLRKLFNGKPSIVIDTNGINYNVLKGLNMTLNDLSEALRNSGCFSFSDVEYAIIETNGKLSVMQKAISSPVTAKQMGLDPPEPKLNIILINDGNLVKENMEYLGLNEEFIEKLVKNKKCRTKDVLVLSYDCENEVYFQQKDGKGETIKIGRPKLKEVR